MVFSLLLSACGTALAQSDMEEPDPTAVEAAPLAVHLTPPELDAEPAELGLEAPSGELTEQLTETPTLDPAEARLAEEALTANISAFLANMETDYNVTTAADVYEAFEARDVPFLVDVRCEGDIAAVNGRYIAGAVVIPLPLLAYNGFRLPDDSDTPIAVYGRSDTDSAIGALTLAALGYKNVTSMQGGSFNAWLEAGYPTGRLISAGPG